MLNKFTANTKKLNNVFTKVNFNNLTSLLSVTESIQEILNDGIPTYLRKFDANTKESNTINLFVEFNTKNNLNLLNVTESIQKIIDDGITPPKKFQSDTKSSSTPTTYVFTGNIINEFHNEILQYSARYIKVEADIIEKDSVGGGESILRKLIVNNRTLDYGTETVGPENFEIFIDGLHVPGIFNVKQNNQNIEITFTEGWIIDDRVLPTDVKIFGKIKPV
jgi:hypothetical protein